MPAGQCLTVRTVAFSPDGRFVATAYWNNAAEVWYVLRQGTKPVVPEFAAQFSKENHLDNWAQKKDIAPERNWREEAWIVLKRLLN